MQPNAAIHYQSDGFDTSAERLMGRQAAGEGFLEALVRHGGVASLYCFTRGATGYDAFRQQIARAAAAQAPPSVYIPETRPERLKEPGCLYVSSPILEDRAAQRATLGSTAYSLCGVNHTLCSTAVMNAIGGYLTAALEPWDALVCTSKAAKAAIEHLLDARADELEARIGARPTARLELPVIPLGVDCDRFTPGQAAAKARAAWRARLDIDENDVAVLFFGRLSYHAKANPAPTFIGLEAAAAAMPNGCRLHLVLAGWFANDQLERGFRQAAAALCPSVALAVVDGRKPEARTALWHAADLFTSLSDNIQESFGLTPIEAMAAGLPSVVSDWDGYRDTVAHGETGFCIPTVAPPPGHGLSLAYRYANGIDSYDRYIGGVSLCTAVDVRAASEAYRSLVADPALRRRLGAAARARALAAFDWRVVIAAYQSLWAELAARRTRAAADASGAAASRPHRMRDPFATFSHYPSAVLSERHRISWPGDAPDGALERLYGLEIANYAPHQFLDLESCRRLVEKIRAEADRSVARLVEGLDEERRALVVRTVIWLAKFGLVEILPPD